MLNKYHVNAYYDAVLWDINNHGVECRPVMDMFLLTDVEQDWVNKKQCQYTVAETFIKYKSQFDKMQDEFLKQLQPIIDYVQEVYDFDHDALSKYLTMGSYLDLRYVPFEASLLRGNLFAIEYAINTISKFIYQMIKPPKSPKDDNAIAGMTLKEYNKRKREYVKSFPFEKWGTITVLHDKLFAYSSENELTTALWSMSEEIGWPAQFYVGTAIKYNDLRLCRWEYDRCLGSRKAAELNRRMFLLLEASENVKRDMNSCEKQNLNDDAMG